MSLLIALFVILYVYFFALKPTEIFIKVRNKRKLLIEQLDQKLKPFLQTEVVLVPERGWINTIRPH